MNEYTLTYSLNTTFNSIQQTCPEALPLARRGCRFWERKKKKAQDTNPCPGKISEWLGRERRIGGQGA